MDALLRYADGRPFAVGVTPYYIGQPGDVAAGQRTVVAVDTGGLYFICDPDLAAVLSPSLGDPLPLESRKGGR